MTRWSPIAVVLGVFLVASCGRKPTSTIVLDKPETTLSHTFQQVSNVVELPDGRLAMADVKSRSFVFLNPSNGEVQELGEHADTIWPPDSFPSRHKIPGFVLRISADTLALVDFGAERTTLWTAQGQPLGVINRVQVGGHNQPLNYDAALNGYKEDVRSVLGGLEPGDEVKYDSLNVLRIPRGDTIADTVARLKLPPWGDGQFGEQKKIVSTIFGGEISWCTPRRLDMDCPRIKQRRGLAGRFGEMEERALPILHPDLRHRGRQEEFSGESPLPDEPGRGTGRSRTLLPLRRL